MIKEIFFYLCPVEPAVHAMVTPNRFRPKPQVPKPGRPFVLSQLCLSRWSVDEGKIMMVMMEWGWGHRGHCTDFLAFALRLKETPGNLS